MKRFDGAVKIDGVSIVSGEFKWDQLTGSGPELDLLAVYQNSASGFTYGTCNVRNALLAEDTIEAFMAFVSKAERDFAQVVATGDIIEQVVDKQPEKPTGLPKGLGNV